MRSPRHGPTTDWWSRLLRLTSMTRRKSPSLGMIDKITPRPDAKVEAMLAEDHIGGLMP